MPRPRKPRSELPPVARLLNDLLHEHGLKVKDLVRRSGISKSTVGRHLAGESVPDIDDRAVYARVFRLTLDQFEQRWKSYAGSRPPDVPIVTAVPAPDEPIGGNDDHPAARGVPAHLLPWSDPGAFAVEVRSDEMAPDYQAGDVVVCCPAAAAENGMLAVVRLVSGDERLAMVGQTDRPGWLELRYTNPRYTPQWISQNETARVVRVCVHIRRLPCRRAMDLQWTTPGTTPGATPGTATGTGPRTRVSRESIARSSSHTSHEQIGRQTSQHRRTTAGRT